MDELPTDMKHTVANFEAKLTELEALLAPFLNEEKSLLPRLSPLDLAKLNLTVSYAITTLFSSTYYTCIHTASKPRRDTSPFNLTFRAHITHHS